MRIPNLSLQSFLPLFSNWNGRIVVEQFDEKGNYVPLEKGYYDLPEDREIYNAKVISVDAKDDALHVLIEGRRRQTYFVGLQKDVKLGDIVYEAGGLVYKNIRKLEVTTKNYEIINRFIGKDFFFSEDAAKRETNRRLARSKGMMVNVRYK